jgi:anti-anti-sigma regulatory factor
MTNPTGKSLVLPAILDLNGAMQLKQDLQEARASGEAISVDASQVQRLSSLCLQLLLAAKYDSSPTVEMSFDAYSDSFREMVTGLGLGTAFGICGEVHG